MMRKMDPKNVGPNIVHKIFRVIRISGNNNCFRPKTVLAVMLGLKIHVHLPVAVWQKSQEREKFLFCFFLLFHETLISM